MKIFEINLKEKYEFLGDEGRNPTLTCYLPYNLVEMGRADEMRPTMVVCPGGGYAHCSEREAEPIALKFLNWGFNVFVINYSSVETEVMKEAIQKIYEIVKIA